MILILLHFYNTRGSTTRNCLFDSVTFVLCNFRVTYQNIFLLVKQKNAHSAFLPVRHFKDNRLIKMSMIKMSMIVTYFNSLAFKF